MSEAKPTVRAMDSKAKDTHFQLRIARDLLALAVLEAERDHEQALTSGAIVVRPGREASKASVSKWIRDLIAAELRRRGVLR